MRIIVSDSSCLIDLQKAELLTVFLQLPYEILIPDSIFHDELLKFTPAQKALLIEGGLKVTELPGHGVERVREVLQDCPTLSPHDGFAFVLAEAHRGCVLLTADGALRTLAEHHKMEVRGVLWIIDELCRQKIISLKSVLGVLDVFEIDPTVRLPKKELAAHRRRYQSK